MTNETQQEARRLEPIVLREKKPKNVHIPFYQTFVPQSYNNKYGLTLEERKKYNLIHVHQGERYIGMGHVVFHHYTSGSTVLIDIGTYEYGIRIYGAKSEEARKDIEELARSKGFELEEVPKDLNWDSIK